jgi:hypothetical protein
VGIQAKRNKKKPGKGSTQMAFNRKLKVKTVNAATFLSQMDSTRPDYYRTCYSSSSSMFCEKYNPGCLSKHPQRKPGEQLDDLYLRLLYSTGSGNSDTTKTEDQLRMHRMLGVNSFFATNGNLALLDRLIAAGHVVMTGQLHKGHVENPNPNASHWNLCVGWIPGPNGGIFVFHDPAGEMDVVNGGYINDKGGKYVQYSWSNWRKRWMADMAGNFVDGSGWYVAPVTDRSGKYLPLK